MDVVRAVILKRIRYTDTQRIIYAFSKEDGYISMITPAYIFKKNDLTTTNMQAVEMEFFRSEKGTLHKLKSVSPILSTQSIYFDIYKMNIALLWSEILVSVLHHEQKNEDLFDFLVKSVEYLNSTKDDYANFNLFFLYRLPGLIGYRINASGYTPGHVFNPHDGSFYAPDGNQGRISGPNTAGVIHSLCTCQLEEVRNISLNRQSRTILLDIILFYLGLHLNTELNTKSIQVIREVFA